MGKFDRPIRLVLLVAVSVAVQADLTHGKSVEVAMRPFWAMQMAAEVPGDRHAPPGFAKPAPGHYDVILEAMAGGSVVASATVRRRVTSPDVVLPTFGSLAASAACTNLPLADGTQPSSS